MVRNLNIYTIICNLHISRLAIDKFFDILGKKLLDEIVFISITYLITH